MTSLPVLTILTAIPAAAAIFALVAGSRANIARAIALVAALASLGIAIWVWLNAAGEMKFVERSAWVPSLGIEYHLGVDGLGALMLLLASIVTLMSIAASRKVTQQPNLYFALILLLESGLFGTFSALNFFHWFLFWELSLIPAFFLIKFWGGEGRGPAATQFFVYTMVGSVALLLAFLALFVSSGSMDFETLAHMASTGDLVPAIQSHLGPIALWLALMVLLGFAVKVPLMPFHTWLPATYSKAPTPVTMLLTGAMSKMGVYGLLRLALPIFGSQLAQVRTPLLILATLTVVAGAWAAAMQKDLKRVFAYSSVNHLGYCLLAIFALAIPTQASSASGLSQTAALDGVILQMFNHGLTAAVIFWFLAMLEDRLEERSGGNLQIDNFGGLRKPAPVFCGLMGIALFSSLGLPGLNGFVSEFLIFRGVFPLTWISATISVLGLLITAAVILTVIQRVFTGPLPERWLAFPDLTTGERLLVAPALILMAALGLWPQLLLGTVNATATHLIAGVEILMLAYTIYISFAGALLLAVWPKNWLGTAKLFALAIAVSGLIVALIGFATASSESTVAIANIPWIPAMGIHYTLAADGISRTLVLLTGLAAVAGILFSWNIVNRANEFFAFFLALIGGVYGVFLSVDLFLLFVFYEIAIVPKYFLIAIWGSTRREYAAMKLALYSFGGSATVLIGLLAAYATSGSHSMNLQDLAHYPFPVSFQMWAFPLVFTGFAILAGMWPFHTWAPTGHVAAPTAASMLLAGVVMKLGAYGCLRVAMTLFPHGLDPWGFSLFGIGSWRTVFALFATIGIVYGAAVALVQNDFKFVIGYSSVSHMGLVLLGLLTLTQIGIDGAVLQMFSHGILAGLLFATVGRIVYERTHTRDLGLLSKLHLGKAMPFAAWLFVLAGMASMGLPGFSGFVAEVQVLIGTWQAFPWFAIVAGIGIVVGVAYTWRAMQRAFFSDALLTESIATPVPDYEPITWPEITGVLLLVGASLVIGLFPQLLLHSIEPAVKALPHALLTGGRP